MRTFAIISHPDAGKTTLTEKLLLYGGAIQMAGSVKARRAQRSATSDWMKIEQERGISVTSTVLQFEYDNYRVNLLDTPGHQDFGEDTYRTLMAADAAVMLLDGGKGVEPVTEKLYAVCRMRQIPVFTFINKMDRPALEPLQLHDEIRAKLGLENTPYNWPIGNGPSFCGVVDRFSREVTLFERADGGSKQASSRSAALEDPQVEAKIGLEGIKKIKEELQMLEQMTLPLDAELVASGQLSPVFFGSAVTNFGVEQLLQAFLKMAPAPGPRQSESGPVQPEDEDFSGFVFKTQANMDPRHRDRIAFIRICSGNFEGGMEVLNGRSGKTVRLANPKEFFGRERETITDAYAGDILGIMNQGQLLIGDTLSSGKKVSFPGIPRFSPEHFCVLQVRPLGAQGFQQGPGRAASGRRRAGPARQGGHRQRLHFGRRRPPAVRGDAAPPEERVPLRNEHGLHALQAGPLDQRPGRGPGGPARGLHRAHGGRPERQQRGPLPRPLEHGKRQSATTPSWNFRQ